jgi:putative transposase
MSAPLSSADAFGISLVTFQRWARELSSFPPSIGQIKPENGRPETAWRASDLPETILVRGRAVALRQPTEQALHDALHAWVPALPTLSGSALVTAPPAAAAAAVKTLRDLPLGAITGRGMVRRPQPEEKLDDQERQARDAALILCRAVEAAQAATDCRVGPACAELAARLLSGDARPELLAAAHATYLKPRPANGPLGDLSAQAARLEKMMKFYEAGRKTGDVAAFLVPGKRHKEGHDPAHIAAFLRFYCLPSRPPVSEAHRAMVPFLQERGLSVPSYSIAARIERALPVTVKYRGRVTGSEWRSLRPYVERDVSMFHSNDIWVGDGHSFKAKVAHPIHGQPFTPEITFILDWVSRKIVGWSIALSESTVAVSDAFRHAQLQTRARPLVYYSDNGSGQTGKMIDHPIAGTLARQGIGHETGLPGNPQARGIIERLWQVTLIRLACTYPTCTWKKADEHTVNKMLKVLNKKDGGGVKNPAFLTLTADVDTCVNDYNTHHAHRELDGAVPEQTY